MAAGRERAHPEFVGEGRCVAVVALGLLGFGWVGVCDTRLVEDAVTASYGLWLARCVVTWIVALASQPLPALGVPAGPLALVYRHSPAAGTTTVVNQGVPATDQWMAQGPAPPEADPAAGRTISLADFGQTIALRVGERVVLALGGDYDWAVQVADPAILEPVAPDAPSGSRVVYEARQPGETVLSAEGRPRCDPGLACPALVRGFRVQFVVS